MANLTVTVSPLAEATTFTELPESPFPATSDMVERRAIIGMDGKAISVRIQQNGSSSKTEIYAIAVDLRPYPSEKGPGW